MQIYVVKKTFKEGQMIIDGKILCNNYENISLKLNYKWNPFNE